MDASRPPGGRQHSILATEKDRAFYCLFLIIDKIKNTVDTDINNLKLDILNIIDSGVAWTYEFESYTVDDKGRELKNIIKRLQNEVLIPKDMETAETPEEVYDQYRNYIHYERKIKIE